MEQKYSNQDLMDSYISTLHDKVLYSCNCKESMQACIQARKNRSAEKKKEYDREYMRNRRGKKNAK